MFEFIRDPLWQFVGVLLTFVTIVITILLYTKQRGRKSLSYEVVSRTPLLSVKEEFRNRLQIFYNKELVQQVHFIIIKIINSGNTPIPTRDFEQPIRLSFGEKARVLTAEIAERNPENLEVSLVARDENVTLSPTLLNEGDFVTLKILVDEFDQITVHGRIIGVKKIHESEPDYFWDGFLLGMVAGGLGSAIFTAVLALLLTIYELVYVALVAVAVSLIVSVLRAVLKRVQH